MYRFIVVFAAAYVSLASADDKDACIKMGDPHTPPIACCKLFPGFKSRDKEMIKQCKDESKPHSCDIHVCLAKKFGYAGATDGTFERKPMEAIVSEDLEENPELAKVVIDSCVYGNLDEFGPQDMCELAKFKHCLYKHLLATCTDWRNDGECEGAEQTVKACIKS